MRRRKFYAILVGLLVSTSMIGQVTPVYATSIEESEEGLKGGDGDVELDEGGKGDGENDEQESAKPFEIYDLRASKDPYLVKEGSSFDLSAIKFGVIFDDSTKSTITGSEVDFNLDLSNLKFGSIDGNKNFTFSDFVKHDQVVPIVATYTASGSTISTNILVKFQMDESKLPQTPKTIELLNKELEDYDNVELEYDDEYDLDDLDFEVEYKSGLTKRLSVSDFKEVSIDSKDRKTAKIEKETFYFTGKAEVGDVVDVTFVYEENGTEVDIEVSFELMEEGESTFNKKPSEIVVDGKTDTFTIDKGEEFDLEDIDFTVIFANGAEKEISGDDLEKSAYSVPSKYSKIIAINSKKEVYFKDAAKVGDTAEIEVSYKANGKTVKTELVFELTGDARKGELTPEFAYYRVGKDEEVDLEKINFFFYEKANSKEKFNVPELKYDFKTSDKKKVNLNTKEHTFTFKESEVKKGDYIEVDFSGKIDGKTKTATVKFIYDSSATTPTNPTVTTPKSFSDISGHWAEQDILNLAKKDMVVGYEGSKYNPNKMVSRGEVAGFISLYLGLNEVPNVSNPFKDINAYHKYYTDVLKVSQAGIFKGYGDGTFKPDAQISREELACILLRAYKEKNDINTSNTKPVQKFADQYKISTWAEGSVMEAKAYGLIGGRPNNEFDPISSTTRAEISSLIWRMTTTSVTYGK